MTIRLSRNGDKRPEMVISKLRRHETWQLAWRQSKLQLTVFMEKHFPHPLILKFSDAEPIRTSATPCLRNVLFFRAESRMQINAASIPKECLPHCCFRFPVLTPHDSNLKMPASLSRACDLSQTI